MLSDPRIDERNQSTSSSTSRRESEENSSAGPSILSPNNIFNFSPGPMGDPMDPVKANNIWAAANDTVGPNSTFGLQPSTRTEGPWRGVETVENIFGSSGAKLDKDGISLEQPPMYNPFPATGINQMGGVDINIGNTATGEYVMDETLQQKILMDLFWPGWPPNLPEPNIVNDLYVYPPLYVKTQLISRIESFFTKVPALPRMMNRAKLLQRMTLPPTHSDFPHASILHAICACASLWCAPAVYAQSAMATPSDLHSIFGQGPSGLKYTSFTMSPPTSTFSSKQADFAKTTIQEGLNSGHKLFDIVRALVRLSFFGIRTGLMYRSS
jgi:hypothetical protein